MKKQVIAIIFALVAAILYAINIPISKLLLQHVDPTMLAGFLYLGAGIGMSIVSLFTRKKQGEYEKIEKHDIIYVIGMIVLDIIAPILLMFGLKDGSSSSASLLNNFEIVATSLIALLIFKEVISPKMWIAISLITVSSFFLSFDDIASFKFSWGSILVLLATCCWGLENNCTRSLSNKNTYTIVILKGLFSGLGAIIVGICLRESFPELMYIGIALALGFVSYGLSIFLYVKAQAVLGASKTSAYYAVNPFIGSILSFILFKEKLNVSYFIGLIIMIIGTVIVVIDTLSRKHVHLHKHYVTYEHDGIKETKVIYHTHEHTHILNVNEHHHHHSKEELLKNATKM